MFINSLYLIFRIHPYFIINLLNKGLEGINVFSHRFKKNPYNVLLVMRHKILNPEFKFCKRLIKKFTIFFLMMYLRENN